MTRRQLAILAVIGGGNLLLAFDLTSIVVAMPGIREELQASPTGLAWAQNAYALATAVALPWVGMLGARLGSARSYLAGLGCFVLGAVAAASAPGIATLVLARAMQGSGAAALLVLGLAVLAATFGDVARVVGFTAASSALGLAAGPVAGGLVVESLGWRGLLALQAGLAASLFAIALASLRGFAIGRGAGPGRRGALLASGAILALAVGAHLITASAAAALACGAIAVLLAARLAREERSGRAPLLPSALWSSLRYRTALIVGALAYAGVAAQPFAVSLALQDQLDWSATAAGLAILPTTLGIAVGAWLGRRSSAPAGDPRLIAIGFATAALGTVAMAAIGAEPWQVAFLLAGSLVSGFGVGLGSPLSLAQGMAAGDAGTATAASSGLWIARQAGTSVGFAALTALAVLAPSPARGTEAMLLGSAALLALAAIAAGREGRGRRQVSRPVRAGR